MIRGKVLNRCSIRPQPLIPSLPAEPGGKPYPVVRGDSFSKIARDKKIDVKRLLQHNFGTTRPEEINYYLRSHLGCQFTTNDRKNYVFVGGETIYLPPPSLKNEEGDLADVLEALGVEPEKAPKVAGIVNNIRMGAGAAAGTGAILAEAVGATAVAGFLTVGGAILAAAGTVLGPLAGILALQRINETGDRMMGYAAPAYAITSWAFRHPWTAPAHPVKYYQREKLMLKVGSSFKKPEEREQELRAIWDKGIRAGRTQMEQRLTKLYRKYATKATREGKTPRDKEFVRQAFCDLLKARYGTNEQIFLNNVWLEAKKNIKGESEVAMNGWSRLPVRSSNYPNF